MTDFERQRNIFNEFIENTQDRFDLIIKDGVNILFQNNCLIFDGLVKITYTFEKYLPVLNLIKPAETTQDLELIRNIINNYQEICDTIRQYVTMYNHFNDFIDKTIDSNTAVSEIKRNIENIINFGQINDQKFFIKSEKVDESGLVYDFYLHVVNYGSVKKIEVDMEYVIIVTNPETGETQESQLWPYKVNKTLFVGDVATQLIQKKCLHAN